MAQIDELMERSGGLKVELPKLADQRSIPACRRNRIATQCGDGDEVCDPSTVFPRLGPRPRCLIG